MFQYRDRHRKEKLEKLVSCGSEIVGGAVGSAVGAILAGPSGAAVGGAASPLVTRALQKVGRDFSVRVLSPREEARVGAGLLLASQKIIQYLDAGRTPRQDGFFDPDMSGRSTSDEILEGVLLKCKNEHEEKKLRLIANIYANVAFMSEVSSAGANWLVQESERLTYRQLCIIALVERKEDKGVSWGPKDGDPAFQMEYQQLDYMFARDHSPDSVEAYELTGEGLWLVGLSRVGEFCYTVMGLEEVPEHDLRELKPHFPRAFEPA